MDAIYYIIFFLFLGVLGTIVYFVNRNSKKERDPFENGANALGKQKFLIEEEIYFQEFLSSHLPKELVVFPRVTLGSILMPIGNKTQYNAISDKCVDYCIFLRDGMMPVLVIDLVYNGYSERLIPPLDKNILDALKIVRLPVLSVEVKDFYVASDIVREIMKILKMEPTKKDDKLSLE